MAVIQPQIHIVFLTVLLASLLPSLHTFQCFLPGSDGSKRPEQGAPVATVNLLDNLTEPCRYDKLRPPPTDDGSPLKVYVKLYFYFLKSYEAHSLQFTVFMLIQNRYQDNRLRWDPSAVNLKEMAGTRELVRRVWTPHVYLQNERESTVMGDGRDLLINIHHDGSVIYSKRLKSTLFCWMKLHKFPFDMQECTLRLNSWSHNMSSLVLEWEDVDPIQFREDLSLTEFSLVGSPISETHTTSLDYDKGTFDDFEGNFSSLTVKFQLKRESGFYVYDYFVPSIMLVVVSWVSFWLEADAVPARVTLGTSTMLTFIILALQTGNSLPKVSYVMASEVWFIVCATFIFASLVEFAFVNIIYRSKRQEIALKKVNSKYIMKEALTPKVKRKRLSLERSTSCPDAMHTIQTSRFGSTLRADSLQSSNSFQGNFPSMPNIERMESEETIGERPRWRLWRWVMQRRSNRANVSSMHQPARMTPKQIAHWIDARSRIVFPVSFIVFNLFYWLYIYCF